MDVLLREVRKRADGRTEYIDTEIVGDVFTVGSAPECALQLLGDGIGPRHAGIKGTSLQCEGGHRVVRNGQSIAKAKLALGDVVEIGGHRLTVIEAPAGFDLAIELLRDINVDASAYESAFKTDLEQTWLGRRRPAWILLLLVLIASFAVPFALRYMKVESPVGVVTDVTWSSGPLLPAHQLAMATTAALVMSPRLRRSPMRRARPVMKTWRITFMMISKSTEQLSGARCVTVNTTSRAHSS